METLDDILSGEAAPVAEPAPQPEVIETPALPETIGQARDEHGRFTAKEPTGELQPETPVAEQVPPTEQEPTHVPFSALRDERRKRQDAEGRIAALEARFASMQTPPAPQPQQPQTPAPIGDFWEDPNGFLNQRFDQFGDAMLERMEQRQAMQRVESSEAAARAKYTDFDEKIGAFQQAVQVNPALAREMASAPDPAEFAYTHGKNALQVQQYGSLDALLAAERAKWEQEALAAIPAARPTAPMTTAADRSTQQRGGPAFAGPTPLTELLG